jgi:predicted GIY-YIG superfamily endonuclease
MHRAAGGCYQWRYAQAALRVHPRERNGTIYIGVTSDLFGRVVIHKQDLIEGFTKRYAYIESPTTRCT